MKISVLLSTAAGLFFALASTILAQHACETWTCQDPTFGNWALTLNQDGTTTAVGGGLKVVGVNGAGSGGNENYCPNPILEIINNWHGGNNACAGYFHTDDADNTLPVLKVVHAGDGNGILIDMTQTTSTNDAAL